MEGARAADLSDARPLRQQLFLVEIPDGLGEEASVHLQKQADASTVVFRS